MGLMLTGVLHLQAQQMPDASDTTYVRFNTNLGNIDVQLLTHEAPLNTANFLSYVNDPTLPYTNIIVNRSVPNFIFQAGDFTLGAGPSINQSMPKAPVQGEHSLPGAFSNTRGTIAFALQAGDPDSGTNQWFFNERDNNNASALANLDSEGFTVFGVVANASSLAVMDAISNVPVYLPPNFFITQAKYDADTNPDPNAKPDDFAFGRIPLQNYDGSTTSLPVADFVLVNSITTLATTNFIAWQAAFQNDPNAATDSLPAAIPQNDHAPNLLKYFCGITGNQTMSLADQAKLPVAGKTTISGATYQTLTYHQRPNPVNVFMTLQSSTDLVTWAAPASIISQQTGTDSDGNSIIQLAVPAPTSGAQFLRLSLSQSPE